MTATKADHLLPTVRKWLSAQRLDGNLRLPAERELAARFCVSRAELRKALAVLEKEGQIRRHVGRGTFIVPDAAQTSVGSEDIAARTSPLMAMQARRIIEPELCRLAALNATSAQVGEMRSLCAEMRKAPSWEAYAELDWRFHNVIAEATGNVLLAEIQALLNGVRRYVVWGTLVKRPVGPADDYHSFREHEAIVDAIAARDGAQAMRAMADHLGGTQAHMRGADRDADLLQTV
ncbi:FadR/GntR family transcriptional regulator [Phenylobacterium sp.]|uniref:FadR/GntR family transcriptional regulator n=1 Tax=Phenylobacterium sp. TaxID=1871053 RepID=UPI002FCC4826